MTRRRVIAVIIWAVVTISAIIWLALGNLTDNQFGTSVAIVVAALLGFGPAKVIAWWRLDHEDPLLPRITPLRIGNGVILVLLLGPGLAAMAGWIDIIPAAICTFGSMIPGLIWIALFSDGYQGFWLDSLIFYSRLSPPGDDYYILTRDENREAAQRKSNQRADGD